MKRPGVAHLPIPENIRSKLDEDLDDQNQTQAHRKKSLNYDAIFGDLAGLDSLNAGADPKAHEDKEEVFLDYNHLQRAQEFYIKSKRRYKSERKMVKKSLKAGPRRRKSSLMSTKTGREEDKLRAFEELESITRGKSNAPQFWRTLFLHYDTLSQSVELEYVVKMYVDNTIVREGRFKDLKDWQRERSVRELAPAKVARYLVDHLLFEDQHTFLDAMNQVYLNDFKHIFYFVIFFIELLKNCAPGELAFPCTVKALTAKYEAVKQRQLKDKLAREIDHLEQAILLIVAEAKRAKATQVDFSQLLTSSAFPEAIRWVDGDPCSLGEHYPLDDNLIFLLPFIGLKLLAVPVTARDYFDLLVKNPKDCIVNTATEDFRELKDELYSQFLSFKLNFSAATLHKYQFKFCEFVFDKTRPLAVAFPEFYQASQTSLLYPAAFYIQLLKKVFSDLHIPRQLTAIGVNLMCGLMAMHPRYVLEREELACLGILYFLLKAFYGLGLNYPSLLTVNKQLVAGEVEDSATKSNILKCLEYIAKIAGQSKLCQFTRELPNFDSLFQNWVAVYRKIVRRDDAQSVFAQTHEEQANLTYKQMGNLIESLGGALLTGAKDKKLTIPFQEMPKIKERQKRGAHAVKVEVKYPAKSGRFVLKEELQEEVDFILNCAATNQTEGVELPHSSDVYVKYKNMGSSPLENFSEDVLIVLELFTVYSGHTKQLTIQGIERCERLIFDMIDSN